MTNLLKFLRAELKLARTNNVDPYRIGIKMARKFKLIDCILFLEELKKRYSSCYIYSFSAIKTEIVEKLQAGIDDCHSTCIDAKKRVLESDLNQINNASTMFDVLYELVHARSLMEFIPANQSLILAAAREPSNASNANFIGYHYELSIINSSDICIYFKAYKLFANTPPSCTTKCISANSERWEIIEVSEQISKYYGSCKSGSLILLFSTIYAPSCIDEYDYCVPFQNKHVTFITPQRVKDFINSIAPLEVDKSAADSLATATKIEGSLTSKSTPIATTIARNWKWKIPETTTVANTLSLS